MSGADALGRLRRDLGTLESYALLVGILVGAGIFRVTGDASARTGPSVILAYLVLAPIVLATSVPYVVFLSTSLGSEPGGEYTHIAHVFGGTRVAFLAAWLKLVSYLGAAAFLAHVLADYSIELARIAGLVAEGSDAVGVIARRALASLALCVFFVIHAAGARWFGRVQVAMCVLLALALVVLVVPGLFAIRLANYRPFFTGGPGGFAGSLAPLFFAYAGFESLAHSAGEVRDSRRRLPRVFLRGIALTTAIFLGMSLVAFGVLPLGELAASDAPMASAAAAYLPVGAAGFVALGGVMAVATSLNATLFAPARLGLMLARDGHLPAWLGVVHAGRGTPLAGLALSLAIATLLVWTGQVSLALNVAVAALMVTYWLHGVALLALPRRNPALAAEVTVGLSRGTWRAAALLSLVCLGGIMAQLLWADLRHLGTTGLLERVRGESLTSLELLVFWSVLGACLAWRGRSRRRGGDLARRSG